MQKLAWDSDARRMLSDPKVLYGGDPTPKAVCANVCVSVWRGLRLKG